MRVRRYLAAGADQVATSLGSYAYLLASFNSLSAVEAGAGAVLVAAYALVALPVAAALMDGTIVLAASRPSAERQAVTWRACTRAAVVVALAALPLALLFGLALDVTVAAVAVFIITAPFAASAPTVRGLLVVGPGPRTALRLSALTVITQIAGLSYVTLTTPSVPALYAAWALPLCGYSVCGTWILRAPAVGRQRVRLGSTRFRAALAGESLLGLIGSQAGLLLAALLAGQAAAAGWRAAATLMAPLTLALQAARPLLTARASRLAVGGHHAALARSAFTLAAAVPCVLLLVPIIVHVAPVDELLGDTTDLALAVYPPVLVDLAAASALYVLLIALRARAQGGPVLLIRVVGSFGFVAVLAVSLGVFKSGLVEALWHSVVPTALALLLAVRAVAAGRRAN